MTMKATKTMIDAQGVAVPVKYIKKYDRERDRIARRIHARFVKAQEHLRMVKRECFADIEKLVAMAEQEAEVSLGGVKGNVQFRSFDGSITVSLDMQARTEFDERLALAQKLILEAVAEMTDGASADLAEIARRAFEPRKSGRMDMQRIRDLRNYKVEHVKWRRACEIIGECERLVGTRQYIRVAERQAPDAKPVNITLDIASIDAGGAA
jgi:hypothetical protein